MLTFIFFSYLSAFTVKLSYMFYIFAFSDFFSYCQLILCLSLCIKFLSKPRSRTDFNAQYYYEENTRAFFYCNSIFFIKNIYISTTLCIKKKQSVKTDILTLTCCGMLAPMKKGPTFSLLTTHTLLTTYKTINLSGGPVISVYK